MSNKYVSMRADSDRLTLACQVWSSFENKLVHIPSMISYSESVLKDSAYQEGYGELFKVENFQ